MSSRHPSLRSVALAASAALASLAHAAEGPKTVPLVVDFAITPAQIDASCKAEIATAGKRIDAIVHARSARTFGTVSEPLENALSDFNDNLVAQVFLFQASPDKAVRDASERCNSLVSGYFAEVFARADLHAALVGADKSHTAHGAAQKKLLEIQILSGKRSGAGLSPAKRKRFVEIAQKITDNETAFASNITGVTQTITITREQTDGLKPDFVAALKPDADGRLVVPVNESTMVPFMSAATSSDARKTYYFSYLNRGGQKNVELLQQTVALRDESAKLLGYPNWSAYTLADRMAGTPQRVASFLDQLDKRLLPVARQQRADLSTLKGSPMDEWDRWFYSDIARKKQFNLDNDAVRQYFPAEHTISAVLDIYSHMLGLTFTRTNDLPTWHKDVIGYRVTDTATGVDRGVFFLDLYPRVGKYNHFANFNVTARRTMPDGTVRPVVNTILGNWPAPVDGKPALLSHDDVLVFFHEFGHNVAALCADTPYESLNNGFRQDFVEAPSQMLENFVWDNAILKKISANVTTGEPLPDALITSMNAGRHFNQAWFEVSQIRYATADQRIHSTKPPVDTTAIWAQTTAEYTPDKLLPGLLPQASFNHLMGGYEASYYAYAWSAVYAQDIFTAFKSGGLENPAVGMRYRNEILAPARMVEPDVLVQNFLGRPMKPDAFYEDLGLSVK